PGRDGHALVAGASSGTLVSPTNLPVLSRSSHPAPGPDAVEPEGADTARARRVRPGVRPHVVGVHPPRLPWGGASGGAAARWGAGGGPCRAPPEAGDRPNGRGVAHLPRFPGPPVNPESPALNNQLLRLTPPSETRTCVAHTPAGRSAGRTWSSNRWRTGSPRP